MIEKSSIVVRHTMSCLDERLSSHADVSVTLTPKANDT